mmetsp:Transcript_57718/g.84437  ORF Transcript_57718/g.84437 Transcript_57718/m.84437 type:complete len:193 (+) Transcript_57718:83-661(+)
MYSANTVVSHSGTVGSHPSQLNHHSQSSHQNTMNVSVSLNVEDRQMVYSTARENDLHRCLQAVLVLGCSGMMCMYIWTLKNGYFFGFISFLLAGLASSFFSMFRQLLVYQLAAERFEDIRRERALMNLRKRIKTFQFSPADPPPKSRRLKRFATQGEAFDTCCICICAYEQGEVVSVILPCSHAYHQECLEV